MKLFDRAPQESSPEPAEDSTPASVKEAIDQVFSPPTPEGELSEQDLERKRLVQEKMRNALGEILHEVELDAASAESPVAEELRRNLDELDKATPDTPGDPS